MVSYNGHEKVIISGEGVARSGDSVTPSLYLVKIWSTGVEPTSSVSCLQHPPPIILLSLRESVANEIMVSISRKSVNIHRNYILKLAGSRLLTKHHWKCPLGLCSCSLRTVCKSILYWKYRKVFRVFIRVDVTSISISQLINRLKQDEPSWEAQVSNFIGYFSENNFKP